MLVFAVTVLALAGLGLFLLQPGGAKPHAARTPATSATPAAPASTPPAPPPSPQPTGSTASPAVNIYQWLPFSQQDLAQASTVATQFGAYYGTYSYNESAASYGSRMQGLATSQLVQTIEGDYATPGLASLRAQQKRIYTGQAVIDSLRAFGPSSLTFVLTVNQKITSPHGQSQASAKYAVTMANAGSGWQVNDIELASSGNQ
jgi:hypothetical protein